MSGPSHRGLPVHSRRVHGLGPPSNTVHLSLPSPRTAGSEGSKGRQTRSGSGPTRTTKESTLYPWYYRKRPETSLILSGYCGRPPNRVSSTSHSTERGPLPTPWELSLSLPSFGCPEPRPLTGTPKRVLIYFSSNPIYDEEKGRVKDLGEKWGQKDREEVVRGEGTAGYSPSTRTYSGVCGRPRGRHRWGSTTGSMYRTLDDRSS